MPEERDSLPPHPNPLPQGRGGRTSSGPCPTRQPQWGRGGCFAQDARKPRRAPTERTSEGGWAGQSRAARSSGMGVWGAQPPAGDARSPSSRAASRGPGARASTPTASPWACLGKATRGGRTALRVTRVRRTVGGRTVGGRGGAAPTERTSEGGWAGQSRAARSSGMGCGGAAPRRRRAVALRGGRTALRVTRVRRTVGGRTVGGRGGAAPTERTSEGGWAGQSRAARSSGMGCGGAAPTGGGEGGLISHARPGGRRRRGRALRPR